MSEFCSDWPLWEFKCEPEDLFKHLDDKAEGIALVKLAQGIGPIDPQGLVNRFAEEVRKRKLLEKEIHPMQSLCFWRAGDLLRDSLYGVPDDIAVEINELYIRTFTVIGEMATNALLERTRQRTSIDLSARRLLAYAGPKIQTPHSDNNFLTAYLGSNAPGHTMTLPNGNELALMDLPAGYVLFTRQREWCNLYPDFSFVDGVSHRVDWQPQKDDDFRVVGLHFIGK